MRFLQQENIRKLKWILKKERATWKVFTMNLEAHARLAVNQVFFQTARGELDITDETQDIQEIIDRKKYTEMSVKKQTCESTMNKIQAAHSEFTDFAMSFGEQLENVGVSNAAPTTDQWNAWANAMRSMVLNDHDRHAEQHELALMRSLQAVQEMGGLSLFTFFFSSSIWSSRIQCRQPVHCPKIS